MVAAAVLMPACVSCFGAGEASRQSDRIAEIREAFEGRRWQQVVELAQALSGRDADAAYCSGVALAQLDRLEEARAILLGGRRLRPRDSRFPVELGGVAFKRKRYAEAAGWLRRGLRLDLVFSEVAPDGGAEIRTVQVESRSGQLRAGEQQMILKTSTVQTFAALSPNGRWLAYADAQAGLYDVYVRSFPDKGNQVLVSNAGGVMPVWSRNGHELFYRAANNRIMVVNYTVKGETFVPDKPRVWSGKQLANLGLAVNFALAPDGKRVAVLMPVASPEPRETQSHVTLVVNFFDEVRRRVAAQGK